MHLDGEVGVPEGVVSIDQGVMRVLNLNTLKSHEPKHRPKQTQECPPKAVEGLVKFLS